MIDLGPRRYLYLTEIDWVVPWERGGLVPIFPARKYLSDVRQGTSTPDEVIQRDSRGVPDWLISGIAGLSWFHIDPGASVHIENCSFTSPFARANVADGYADARAEDGLILSLSTDLDSRIARQLGKAACVRIRSMDRLVESLNAQIGARCTQGLVQYRDGYARNHFLKAPDDAWQKEYRLFWFTGDVTPREVILPPGIATRVYW